MRKLTLEEVEDEIGKASDMKKVFLEQNGWKYSSNNPTHRWLFEKSHGGKDYICDTDTAFMVEQYICPIDQE